MSTRSQPSRALPDAPRLTPLPAIFISHSSTDNDFGKQLTTDLRNMGYDVWYDSYPGRDASGLVPGDAWFDRIQLELTNRPVFLVILSPSSMASPWVRDEVSMAWQQKNSATGKVIIPVLYLYTSVLPALATIQFVSFLKNCPYENAFAELLKAIRLGKTREREMALLPLVPSGPPFEEGLLPVPDPFVGREEDLAWVVEHLQAGGTTSITPIAALAGMGGIGKTALATKAVQVLRQQGHFSEGVGVLLCQGMRDPIEMLRQILSHFDPQRRLPDERLDMSGLTTLAHMLLDRKDALIVLDNIEPDWPVEQVVGVLRATGITLLLTARQTLPQSAVPVSVSYLVGLLPQDEARALFETTLGRAVSSPPEVKAVEQIITTLDRHTLAVKLAGAYASTGRDLPILARILTGDPLWLPGEDSATQAERAVELVLSQSLATLQVEQEQHLFTCLSAFATPEIGRNAVLALAEALAVPEPERSVDQLVRRALCEPSVVEKSPVASDRERLRLHPLLWALAQRHFLQLPLDLQTKAQDAIAIYYASYANETAVLALGLDEANIVGSLHWASAHSDDELEAEIAHGIRKFWRDTDRTRIALEELPPAVAAAERIASASGHREDRLRAAQLSLTYAQILQDTGRLGEAEREYRSNHAIRREVQDRRGEGSVLFSLGQIALQRGQLDEAERLFQLALAIDQEVQDRRGEGTGLSTLGQIALQRGQLDEAERLFQQALVIVREVQDRRDEGVTLSNLGEIALQRGQLDEAERLFQQALVLQSHLCARMWGALHGAAL